jgi:hypothetical protein
MADQSSTYALRLAAFVGEALAGTAALFADFRSDNLGIDLPDAVFQTSTISSLLAQMGDAATAIGDASSDLESVAASGDETKILETVIKLGVGLGKYFVTLGKLVEAVQANISSATLPPGADPAAAQAFIGDLAGAIADFAFAAAITVELPPLGYALKILGLLDWRLEEEKAGDPLSRTYIVKRLHLERIKDLISAPGTHFSTVYKWGTNDFEPSDFFRMARQLYPDESAIEVGIDDNGDAFIASGVSLQRDSTSSPYGLKAAFHANYSAAKTWTLPLTDVWEIGLNSNLQLTGDISASVFPPFEVKLDALGATISGGLKAFFDRAKDQRPFDILAGTGGLLQISATNVTAGIGLDVGVNTGGEYKIDPLIYADIDAVTLTVGSDDADSFLGTLLSGAEIKGQFDLGLEWQMSSGLRIKASGGIEIALPIHKSLGPIELDTVYVALKIKDDGALSLEASAALGASLGPLQVSVDRMGVLFNMSFASGSDAKYGPFDLGVAFKPPTGAGLEIDAGIVTGGGFLSFDPDKGEYAGIAELSIADVVTIKAIGLVTTKMPDGTDGFSLLVIISAEFTPVQLGFGFTLNGVGGLLGLNRAVLLDVLRDGVRTGAINSIMFPENIVANAARIISDLKAIFPPKDGTFLIGPMAKFGWGTPSLVTLSIGIVIEIPPGNIALIGILKVALPDEEVALIQIQVSFVGTLDFDEQLLAFDASIFDSHVLFIGLEGDMAVRLKWGDNASFLLSVGGFHPAFKPPEGLHLPTLRRLAISILDYDWAKIRVECYFAVTSNTVQFGAHLYLFFGVSAAHISGQLGLDVLFQFSPFYFDALITGSLAISVAGCDLLSIDLRLELSGPSPWRAQGTGSVHILFFTIDAAFDVTWGDPADTALPPVDVMPLFLAEMNKQENWKAVAAPSSHLLVSLRGIDPALLVLHPFGSLTVSQRSLPLAFTLDKIGTKKPDDVNRVDITGAVSGPTTLPVGEVDDQFALAQFQNLTDAEKLSKPSYQLFKSGVTIGTAEAMQSSKMTRRVIAYETIIEDKEPQRPILLTQAMAGLFAPFLAGAAVAQSPLSNQVQSRLQPYDDKIGIGAEGYTVASTLDNTPHDATSGFSSEAMATQYMQAQAVKNPSIAGQLHVLPNHEVNA